MLTCWLLPLLVRAAPVVVKYRLRSKGVLTCWALPALPLLPLRRLRSWRNDFALGVLTAGAVPALPLLQPPRRLNNIDFAPRLWTTWSVSCSTAWPSHPHPTFFRPCWMGSLIPAEVAAASVTARPKVHTSSDLQQAAPPVCVGSGGGSSQTLRAKPGVLPLWPCMWRSTDLLHARHGGSPLP